MKVRAVFIFKCDQKSELSGLTLYPVIFMTGFFLQEAPVLFLYLRSDFLTQDVDWPDLAFVLKMPERPAVARGQALKRCADLVN